MLADLQLKSNICIRNCQTSYYIFGIFQTKSVRPTSHVRASDWTVGLPTLLSTSTSWKKTLNYHYIMIHIGWLSTAFLLSSKTLYLRSKFPLSFVASSEKFNILLYMPMCPVTFQISVYFVRIFLRISSAFSKYPILCPALCTPMAMYFVHQLFEYKWDSSNNTINNYSWYLSSDNTVFTVDLSKGWLLVILTSAFSFTIKVSI